MSAEQKENDCVWKSVGKDFRCWERVMIKLSWIRTYMCEISLSSIFDYIGSLHTGN